MSDLLGLAGRSIEKVGENMPAIRDDTHPLVFPVVPDGHGDHIRYSFAMASSNRREEANHA